MVEGVLEIIIVVVCALLDVRGRGSRKGLRRRRGDKGSKVDVFLGELLKRSTVGNSPVLHDKDTIDKRQELELMSDEDTSCMGEGLADALFKQELADMSIDCTERVIKEKNITVGVDSTGQVDSLFLAS